MIVIIEDGIAINEDGIYDGCTAIQMWLQMMLLAGWYKARMRPTWVKRMGREGGPHWAQAIQTE